jgi:hypothetical protein
VNCVAHYNLKLTITTVINNHQQFYWHVVQWNERLYEEMLKAYLEGRAATDPSDSWYKGVRCVYRMHQRFLVVSSSAGLTCVDWGLIIFFSLLIRSWAFSTFTLFLWPKSWTVAECKEHKLMDLPLLP